MRLHVGYLITIYESTQVLYLCKKQTNIICHIIYKISISNANSLARRMRAVMTRKQRERALEVNESHWLLCFYLYGARNW